MPTFDTPEPISVTVELGVGDLRIVASDRTDTMVEVRPSDAAKKADMTEGIIARFRTMAIYRPSILTGHVVSAITQTACSLAIVLGVALLIGFRPTATPVEWTATVGLLMLITFTLIPTPPLWMTGRIGNV
jgi:hypothetical protein